MLRIARILKYKHNNFRLYSLKPELPKVNNTNGVLEGSNMNEQYIADQLLKDQVFNKEQVDRLFEVFKKNMGAVTKKRIEKENLATREEIIKMIQIKTNSFNKIENEIIIDHLDKIKEYKQEIISLTSDLEKLQKNFNMEIRKCNGAFKLDLSLEKGRIKEINSLQELKIKDIDTKLSEEINNINTKIEANKTQLIQWMYTIVFAAIGIILAFFRLIS
ncbi:uncharacterized protein HGUI_02630 [Hanseniaspora guilliermondii]|uniref:Protein FMP32, mitochondrial n=1 Tax=Hanseniaspora guilliermondii TaxID=56406 RepID=A0A1L0FLI9_9ASCO|nr:uncharacterized protein HGUI_02630 [Hanseniaspora guilliermondii]